MQRTLIKLLVLVVLLLSVIISTNAQERRPIDSQHPLWLVHVDVWNKADPQKIINLIPDDIKPYVCMNLSLSCQYDTEKNVYKMPQNAVRTYKSWATICQQNGLWFTCQPASGGHTHIQDDDLETFEYFFKRYPNFLGWNYAEQFWGFDEAGDKSSSTQTSRIALFAKLVEMSHNYGGFLTVSFCGNIWSHPLNPVGMMKRNKDLLNACRKYPEAILWLYKYTTSSCFYNNESVTWSPFVSGLAKNYGVRYDNCGWNGALDALLGENHGKKYPIAAGIGTVMEQTCVNGGAVWDGPELIWTEDFENLANTTVDGYSRRNWGTFPGFDNAWIDMFRKIIDGTMYIPTREEVVGKTKIAVINNITTGGDEDKYAAWGDLYDGLYKQTDPFNRGNGQWMDNFCYFKKTGRYGAIPVCVELYDDLAKTIPVQVKKSLRTTRWSSQTKKVEEFNKYYPEVSTGTLYVNRYRNQLVTYTPYTYSNKNKTAKATIPLQYNTCETLQLEYGMLSSGVVREYADHIDMYLNNYRTDTTKAVVDKITVTGAVTEPTYTIKKRGVVKKSIQIIANATSSYNPETMTWTLEVSHMGPVDLTINCSGNGTDRLEDILPNKALEAPKQPEEYNGEIILEAEDMDFKSIKSCVTDPYGWYPNVRGHAGNGFVDMGTSTSGALKYIVNIKKAGEYKIAVRYTNTAKAANMYVKASSRKILKFTKTATNEWNKVSCVDTFKEGNNTIILTNIGGIACYVDQIILTPVDAEPEKFALTVNEAEHGTIEFDSDQVAEGDTVTLKVTPETNYKLSDWNIIHGNIKLTQVDDETYTFVMPDDNVTLTPVFRDVTLVYTLDFTNVLSGTIPPGWVCVQGTADADIHQYPNEYTAGARVFAGFTGYQGKALYWRDNYAEYGRQSAYPLTLVPGRYRLTYAMAAWKSSPKYQVNVFDPSGNVAVSSASTLGYPNAAGSTSAKISTAKEYTLVFDVTAKGNYVIQFLNSDVYSGMDEFLLVECNVNTVQITIADITELIENYLSEGSAVTIADVTSLIDLYLNQ